MYEVYKGYVPTKQKTPLIKFKDAITLEEVQSCEEYAGVLNTDTILIDIDDLKSSEKVFRIVKEKNIKCNVFKTRRGMHFIFRNQKKVRQCTNHSALAIGVIADIKVGLKNSIQLLKARGKLRECVQSFDELDVIPDFLTPVSGSSDFTGMGDGDGRNQALFNHILTLQSAGFTKEEITEMIHLTNEYVFDEPLNGSELDVILREESFGKPNFFKNGQFLHNVFGDFIIKQNHIVRINGELHIYKDGVYVTGSDEIEGQMIEIIPNLKATQRTEVLKYIRLVIRNDVQLAPEKYIAFKNGILNLETMMMEDFSPDKIITNKIDFDYNPSAESELVKNTLLKLSCYDTELVKLLEEVAGYCFYRRNELRKMFFLLGEKHNGKSTYLFMIQTMLGESNVSNLDISDIGDRFRTAELSGKLANIGDDIGDAYIADASVIKKVASGDPVTVERKGQDPFKVKPYNKLLFSANNIPRIKDDSEAVLDRMIIVPFENTFSPDQPDFDPFLKDKLKQKESIEYLIRVGVEGLRRVVFSRKFTICKRIEESLEEYELQNNPLHGFFKEITRDEIIGFPSKDLYLRYTDWADEMGIRNTYSAIKFGTQVCKKFDCCTMPKKIDGKTIRVYEERKND